MMKIKMEIGIFLFIFYSFICFYIHFFLSYIFFYSRFVYYIVFLYHTLFFGNWNSLLSGKQTLQIAMKLQRFVQTIYILVFFFYCRIHSLALYFSSKNIKEKVRKKCSLLRLQIGKMEVLIMQVGEEKKGMHSIFFVFLLFIFLSNLTCISYTSGKSRQQIAFLSTLR